MNHSPVFELRNIRKTYASRTVLRIDQLLIYLGEVLALVGPSGAGKSTLLRLLNFLEPPSDGSLSFNGNLISTANKMPRADRRRVTTVFQRPLLLNRSVRANVAFGLRLRGAHSPDPAVDQALAQVGLLPLANQQARKLSGGEAQRVALARAMVIKPEVLLLDEPTANLDPYNTGLIEKTITQINIEEHTTVVLVTHNIFQARRLAQRVGLMLAGELVEIAPVERFFQAPADPRSAAFIRGDLVF